MLMIARCSPFYYLSRCLKITEKVSFNFVSAANYVYILSGQKFLRKAKNAQFGQFLKTWSLRSNSVTRQSILIGQQLAKNAKIQKFQMRHFGWFSNNVPFLLSPPSTTTIAVIWFFLPFLGQWLDRWSTCSKLRGRGSSSRIVGVDYRSYAHLITERSSAAIVSTDELWCLLMRVL